MASWDFMEGSTNVEDKTQKKTSCILFCPCSCHQRGWRSGGVVGRGLGGGAVTVAAALYTNRIPKLTFFHFRFFLEHVALCAPNSFQSFLM